MLRCAGVPAGVADAGDTGVPAPGAHRRRAVAALRRAAAAAEDAARLLDPGGAFRHPGARPASRVLQCVTGTAGAHVAVNTVCSTSMCSNVLPFSVHAEAAAPGGAARMRERACSERARPSARRPRAAGAGAVRRAAARQPVPGPGRDHAAAAGAARWRAPRQRRAAAPAAGARPRRAGRLHGGGQAQSVRSSWCPQLFTCKSKVSTECPGALQS